MQRPQRPFISAYLCQLRPKGSRCRECYRVSPDVASPPGQFAFRDDVPLVRLEVADEWVRPEQAVVRYRIETVFARSSWDWIGLYRVRRAGVVNRSGRELGA